MINRVTIKQLVFEFLIWKITLLHFQVCRFCSRKWNVINKQCWVHTGKMTTLRSCFNTVTIRYGVRWGCVLLSSLIKLRSEILFQQAPKNCKGIKLNGTHCDYNQKYTEITNLMASYAPLLQLILTHYAQNAKIMEWSYSM